MKEELNYLWGTSQKADGQMSVYSSAEASSNREKFFAKLGLEAKNLVLACLSHSNNVSIVGEVDKGQRIENTDGLITKIPGVILTITSADCLPIFFFDKANRAIGLAHAGWRGVENNIASNVIKKMQSEFGTKPEEVVANIGPHIKNCHFEIKEDLVKKFSRYEDFITTENGVSKLDLSAIVQDQLLDEGIKAENIKISVDCTHCLSDKYFSFRRDHPERTEVMVSYSVIKN